ncbi:MAG: mechanosensitive ion channel family protein, partial [Phycisphaerales bacterium JB064]
FGLVYVAHAMDYEVLPLLTGLGIGGLAVAFAAKDTIENFFGSIAVIADRPFEVGDWVKVDDVEGTVEELGLRSTRIRTFYDSLVTVPNATLVRAVVDNFGRRRYRRFSTHLALPYGTPPEKIEAFCEGVREIIEKHPKTRKDVYHIYLNRFGDSSLDVLVYIFHECPDWATELAERQRFMLDVLRLAEDVGVEFAFPTRTLHVLPDEEWDDVAFAGRERERDARDPRTRGERDGGDVGGDDGKADGGDDGDGGEDGGR